MVSDRAIIPHIVDRIVCNDCAVVEEIARRIGCVVTVGIMGIIGIARRLGIFVDVRLRHYKIFALSVVVEDGFQGNYSW